MNSLSVDLQWAFNFAMAGLVAVLGLLKREQDARIRTNSDALRAVELRVAAHDANIARLDAQHDSVFERLDRIEAKLDRVLEDRA